MENTYGNIVILDILALVLSPFIIINSVIIAYYSLKYITCKTFKTGYDWIAWILFFVGIAWATIFSYIFYKDIIGEPVFLHNSFGALYIRPIILFNTVALAVSQKLRYNKLIIYGGTKWDKKLRK